MYEELEQLLMRSICFIIVIKRDLPLTLQFEGEPSTMLANRSSLSFLHSRQLAVLEPKRRYCKLFGILHHFLAPSQFSGT